MKRPKNILLVGDDETTNALNTLFIWQVDERIKVKIATKIEEALDYIVSGKEELLPLMILLDMGIPTGDGPKFLNKYEAFVEDDFKKKIKLILLNSIEDTEVVQKASKDPNVCDTVRKPLSDIIIKSLLTKHFRK